MTWISVAVAEVLTLFVGKCKNCLQKLICEQVKEAETVLPLLIYKIDSIQKFESQKNTIMLKQKNRNIWMRYGKKMKSNIDFVYFIPDLLYDKTMKKPEHKY